MFEKLDTYLDETSHFLSGREEREEILSEIRSHILEKAEREHGGLTAEAVDAVIASYGPPRRVAEKYLDGRAIIAPAYRRYLFRYTTLLFAVHFVFTVVAVTFKVNFVLFPFLFVPRLGVIDAFMYLPTALLADLGIVTLVLYFITQSRKDLRLPWPTLTFDIDELKVGRHKFAILFNFLFTLAITVFVIHLYARHGTIFFSSLDFSNAHPLLLPAAGRQISLIVIAAFAVNAMTSLVQLLIASRWVSVAASAIYLVLFGLLLGQPFDNLFAVPIPESLFPKIKFGLKFAIFFFAFIVAIQLLRDLVIIGRGRLRR